MAGFRRRRDETVNVKRRLGYFGNNNINKHGSVGGNQMVFSYYGIYTDLGTKKVAGNCKNDALRWGCASVHEILKFIDSLVEIALQSSANFRACHCRRGRINSGRCLLRYLQQPYRWKRLLKATEGMWGFVSLILLKRLEIE